MSLSVLAIIRIVAPILIELVKSKVPKDKYRVYPDTAKQLDKMLDSLDELSFKALDSNNVDSPTHLHNLKTSLSIVEGMLHGMNTRLQIIKDRIK